MIICNIVTTYLEYIPVSIVTLLHMIGSCDQQLYRNISTYFSTVLDGEKEATRVSIILYPRELFYQFYKNHIFLFFNVIGYL